jgi:hypothetical protein
MLVGKWHKTRKVWLYFPRLINEKGRKQLFTPGHTSKKVASQFEAKLKVTIYVPIRLPA